MQVKLTELIKREAPTHPLRAGLQLRAYNGGYSL